MIVVLLVAPLLNAPLLAQYLKPNPNVIYFGDMSVDQRGISREITIENTGTTSIQIQSVDFSGQHASQFAILSGSLPQSIAPGTSVAFLIKATPTSYPTRYMEATLEFITAEESVFVPLHATSREPGTYYVSPSGNDANPGSEALPWKTIQNAAGRAVPKDTILVEDGLYEGPVVLVRSGEADAYITYKSVNKWGAKIQVTNGEGAQDGIKVVANYITLDGFEIYDPAPGPGRIGNGVTVYSAHHVNVINNKIYDFGASGIQGAFCDHVLFENNTVYDNAKYNPTQSSGISIWRPFAVDDAPGYHIIIRNNRSFGNITITKNENGVNSDGNGIIIDKSWNSKNGERYPHRTLIENNLVYDNGGSGIHIHNSSHIDIFNNTSFHNRKNKNVLGTWRGELYTNGSEDTVWRNNIAVSNPGEGPTAYNRAIFAFGALNALFENNITYSTDINDTYSVTTLESEVSYDEIVASNLVGVNPGFQNTDTQDFSLRPGSQAIDAGSDEIVSFYDINYLTRTQNLVDIGAFEYYEISLQVQLTSFQAQVADQDIQLSWTTASELNNAGFALELRTLERNFEQTRFIEAEGTTYQERRYETTLEDISPGNYFFRLKKVGMDGSYEYSNVIEAVVEDLLPVELTSFEAISTNENLHLRWTTASELNNAGFSVELRKKGASFEPLHFVHGQGTINEAHTYEITLPNLAAGVYSFRLKQIDFDGSFEYSDIIEVSIGTNMYQLEQSYPNPFNPQTLIPYTLPTRSHVTLEVFNLLGQKIQTLVNEEQAAGAYSVLFKAENLSNGTYLYRITAGTFSETRSMMLIK